MKAKIGHGITVSFLERLCDLGLFKPTGKYVLVRAIWEQHAKASIAAFNLNKEGESTLSIMEAVAFEVHGVGPEVPEGRHFVGDVILNTSISGETINGNKQAKGSPWMCVHYEDLVGRVAGEDLARVLADIRAEAVKEVQQSA